MASTTRTIRRYELSLPTFKQGDDMAHCLEKKGNDSAAALLMLADLYTECARLVRRAASVAAEGDLTVTGADVHYISVSGTPARLDALVAEHVLSVHEDEYDEYEDDEMDPEAADDDADDEPPDDPEPTDNLDDGTSRGSRW